jgi:hypothetical protein
MLFLLDPSPHVLVMLDQSGDGGVGPEVLRPELAPALPTHGVQFEVLFDATAAVVVLAREGAGIVEELVTGNENSNTKQKIGEKPEQNAVEREDGAEQTEGTERGKRCVAAQTHLATFTPYRDCACLS